MGAGAPREFEAWSEARAVEVLTPLATMPGALLPMCHRLQEVFGCVDPRATPLMADLLNWSQAEVHGVVSFYKDFRAAPPGRRVVRVCRAEACQSVGGRAVAAAAEELLGIGLGETTGDGALTLEAVYCLGNCALGPSAQVDGELVGRVDRDWVADLASGRPSTGPSDPWAAEAASRAESPDDAPGVGETVVYVPADAAARSIGADAVARSIDEAAARSGRRVRIVRNGSRGMTWLEPLVEVATARGRIAYGPVAAEDVPGLFDAGLLDGGEHRLGHGLVGRDRVPQATDPRTFARVGVIDPLDLEEYQAHGRTRRPAPGAGADAGEPSSRKSEPPVFAGGAAPGFPDRHQVADGARRRGRPQVRLLQRRRGRQRDVRRPDADGGRPLLPDRGHDRSPASPSAPREGSLHALGVPRRGRHDDRAAIDMRREPQGLLGSSVLGSGRSFDLELRVGAGAYICGEETAMLESLEGRRGMVRAKPPLPAHRGPVRQADGDQQRADASRPCRRSSPRAARPTPRSASAAPAAPRSSSWPATSPAAGSSRCAFGSRSREPRRGVRRGHAQRPAGARRAGRRPARRLPAGRPFDLAMDYEAFAAAGAMVGHGGIVVFDDTVDMAAPGPIRDGVLRRGVLRQVHAVSHRLGPRGRGDRQDHRRRRARGQPRLLEDLCETDDRRLALRDGGPHADAGAQRARALPRGFRRDRAPSRGADRPCHGCRRTHDLAERARPRTISRRLDRRSRSRSTACRVPRARGDLGDASRGDRRHRRPQALRDRLAGCVRLLPALPRRDRRAQRARPPRARRRSPTG